MQRPQVPENEAERLRALRDMDILDTPAEGRFDQVTRLAALVFGVPIALVSLVDSDRQWFKSCVGLDVAQTGRDVSFCGHAILQEELFIVEDALQDARFADNPLVVGAPFVRFYAGKPLHSPDGLIIGTLCIIDTKPRHLDADGRARLTALGHWVEMELQNRTLGERAGIVQAANRHQFWSMSKDLLCVAGLDGYLKDVSPSFPTTLGYTEEELLTRPFLDFVHKDDVAATLAEMEHLKDGEETLHFRNRYRHRNGRYLWFDWTAVPHLGSLYAVARDVTDEVIMEQRLARVIKTLQDSTAAMREFTSIVSHDLRAPVRRLKPMLADMQPEAIAEIDRIDSMIDAIVRYERVQLADAPLQQVDLDEVWDDQVALFRAELPGGAVHKQGDLGTVMGDPDQLAIVVRNLLDNSIKYQRPDHPLSVRVHAIVERERVTVHYVDDGRGLSPEIRANLWVPFQGRPGAGNGNHGLGMPTIKRIIERHGGTIEAMDVERGVHFSMTFQRHAAPPSLEEALAAISADAVGRPMEVHS